MSASGRRKLTSEQQLIVNEANRYRADNKLITQYDPELDNYTAVLADVVMIRADKAMNVFVEQKLVAFRETFDLAKSLGLPVQSEELERLLQSRRSAFEREFFKLGMPEENTSDSATLAVLSRPLIKRMLAGAIAEAKAETKSGHDVMMSLLTNLMVVTRLLDRTSHLLSKGTLPAVNAEEETAFKECMQLMGVPALATKSSVVLDMQCVVHLLGGLAKSGGGGSGSNGGVVHGLGLEAAPLVPPVQAQVQVQPAHQQQLQDVPSRGDFKRPAENKGEHKGEQQVFKEKSRNDEPVASAGATSDSALLASVTAVTLGAVVKNPSDQQPQQSQVAVVPPVAGTAQVPAVAPSCNASAGALLTAAPAAVTVVPVAQVAELFAALGFAFQVTTDADGNSALNLTKKINLKA